MEEKLEQKPFSYPVQQPKNLKTKVVIAIVTLVIIALIGGFFMNRQSKTGTKKEAVVEKKEPTPTEKPKIEKSSVKIQVLNGTGVEGQAGIVVNVLKEAGYNTDNIKTDNAENFDNPVTTISARNGFEDTASEIKDALKSKFDEINIDSSKFDDKSEFDIVVVTGGKKPEATPTTKITPTESPTPSSVNTTPTPTLTPTATPTPTGSTPTP